MSETKFEEIEISIGPSSIANFSRLSYTMWYALAEFIDNSTQSRLNYDRIIDEVLKGEGTTLTVEISYNRMRREIEIRDNSIGMDRETLEAALRIAHPTKDSRGRSKYGMGMKTASCWIGDKWKVITCKWASGIELTVEVDVKGIATEGKKIRISERRGLDTSQHYTRVVISDMHRNMQVRTEETIRGYLSSMYRFDLEDGKLKLLFNGEEIAPVEVYDLDTDNDGRPMRREIPRTSIGAHTVSGWFGVMRKGGRKFGGFSLFQHRRQIQGYPSAWKPKLIFGGFDDEGANNLIAQRLTGVIELDGFDVSHTKDTVIFRGDEEDHLEKLLLDLTKDFRDYALRRRGTKGQPWAREKVRDIVESMRKEFTGAEIADAVNTSILPPLSTILANNRRQLEALAADDNVATFSVTNDLRVVVSLQERSENDPYVILSAGADVGTMHVVINSLHPYYETIESPDAIEECIRQYVYDAIAEYRVSKLNASVTPQSVGRLKDSLLRAQSFKTEIGGAIPSDSGGTPAQ